MKKLPQHLSQLLHQSGRLPDLAEKAELLLYLNQHVKQLLSGPVSEQLKVANLRQSVLVIETPSAAWAARINFQKKPNFLPNFRQKRSQCLPLLRLKSTRHWQHRGKTPSGSQTAE